MKANKIREMNKEDIIQKIKESKMDLLKLRFESAANQLKNPFKKKEIRKDIARMLTIIKEK